MWTHQKEKFRFQKNTLTPVALTILESLYVDAKADLEGDEYIVNDAEIVVLSDDDKASLELPTTYITGMSVETEHFLQSPKYGYRVRFKDAFGNESETAVLDGAYLRIDNREYLLNPADYRLASQLNRWEQEDKKCEFPLDDKGFVESIVCRERLSRIKKIQDTSEMSSVNLSNDITRRKIISAPKLKLGVKSTGDGFYKFEPSFVGGDIKDTELVNEVYRRYDDNLRPEVSVGRDTFVLYDDNQLETIRNAKKLGKKNKEEIKQIISQAPSYFPAAFTYDEKITGIGDYSDVPELGLVESSQSWVPDGEFFGIELPLDWETEELHDEEDKLPKDKISNPSLLYDPNIVDKGEEIPPADDGLIRSYTTKDWHSVRPEITLKSYQKQGVNYLQELWHKGYKGALLADDMGLGKTLQTLVFSSWVTEQTADEESMPIGIVAPVGLIRNWEEEYKKFINPTLWGEPLVLRGEMLKSYIVNKRPPEIDKYLQPGADLSHVTYLDIERIKQHKLVLMTYETVRKYQLSLGALRWRMFILDEAQKIKNPKSGVSLAIRAMKYEFALALTGTPVENSWTDLWTILSFCRNSTGISLQRFMQKFIKPVKSNPELIEQIGAQLKEEIKPILLRRMKDDVLDELPKKKEITVRNPMPEEQWSLYQAILARRTNDSLGEGKDHIFKTIQQLRLASLHPYYYKKQSALLAMDDDMVIQSSARFVGLFNILDEIQTKNEKVLVFLRDKKIQQLLRSLIKNRYGILVPPAVNGDLDGGNRQEIVKEFNHASGFRVLLLSAEAGGVGLNITGANHVVHLSREWNPAKEDQATDRAYRIGQQKDVYVYYPLAIPEALPAGAGFDEQLNDLLAKKRNLSRKVIIPTEFGDGEMSAFSNNVLVDFAPRNDVGVITTPLITLKDLQEYERDLLPLIIEWCCEATGYKVLKCQKKKTGIDVLLYNLAEKAVYVLELVSPFAHISEAEQVKGRFATLGLYLSDVLRENGFDEKLKPNKRVICFDAATEQMLINDVKVNPSMIWGPEQLTKLLKDANLRQSDVAVILNHNAYV